MADDILLDGPGSGGATIATEEEGGVHYQKVKLTSSGSGTTAELSRAEDAAHTSGDHGIPMLGVYKADDAQGVDAGTANDYAMPHIDVRGRLRVSPGSLQILDNFNVTTGWGVFNDDAANIATDLNHVLATKSLEFDKVAGGSATTDAIIEKTITSVNVFNLVTGAVFLQGFCNIPNMTNVVNYIMRMGTDNTNYNEWRIDASDSTAGIWEIPRTLMARSTGFAGNGMNLLDITYIAVGVEFSSSANTLVDILWDALVLTGGQVHDVDISGGELEDVRLAGYKTSNVDTGSGNLSGTKTLRVTVADDDTNLAAIKTATETVAAAVATEMQVDVVTSALPSGAATSAAQLGDGHNVTIDNSTGGAAVNIQDGGNVITVDGTITEANSGAILADTAAIDTATAKIATGVHADGATFTDTTSLGMGCYGVHQATPDTVGDNDFSPILLNSSSAQVVDLGSNNNVTIDSGTVTTVSTVTNLAQMGAAAISMNTGARDAGTQRVTLATDDALVVDLGSNNDVVVTGNVAIGAATTGNPVILGGRGTASVEGIAEIDEGDVTYVNTDLSGTIITRAACAPAELVSFYIANTDGNEDAVTSLDDGGAAIYNFITSVTIHNANASTNGFVTLLDGSAGSIFWVFPAPATGGTTHNFDPPLRQPTISTALFVDVSAAISTMHISINGYQGNG